MKVRDTMVPHKECVGPNETAAVASQLIDESKAGAVPVLDHKAVAGTVQPHQVTDKVEQLGRKAEQVRVREVMSERNDVAFEEEDTEVVRLRMKAAGLNVIPVFNAENKLVGMLHITSA